VIRILFLSFFFLLASCSVLNPVSLLTGGGPKVAANVQAGKTNTQTIGTTKLVEMAGPVASPENVGTFNQNTNQSADDRVVTADRVETVVVNQIPMWLLGGMFALVILFGIVGWLSPQPRWLDWD
jgi:hypothetical protein